MPGIQQPETKAIPLYNKSDWQYPSFISTATKPPYDDEYLGPNEVSYFIYHRRKIIISIVRCQLRRKDICIISLLLRL
jgi:hypothetical protein